MKIGEVLLLLPRAGTCRILALSELWVSERFKKFDEQVLIFRCEMKRVHQFIVVVI
jgi:hypothetical protein